MFLQTFKKKKLCYISSQFQIRCHLQAITLPKPAYMAVPNTPCRTLVVPYVCT